MQDRLNQGKEKYKRAALLLTEFLGDIMSGRTNVLTSGAKQAKFNLTSQIEDMSKEDKIELMFTLLSQLQPYLSAGNLTVMPAPHYQGPQT